MSNLPKAARPTDAPVNPLFLEDLVRSGKAVRLKPGESFPPTAEYEIVEEDGKIKLIHRQVSGGDSLQDQK